MRAPMRFSLLGMLAVAGCAVRPAPAPRPALSATPVTAAPTPRTALGADLDAAERAIAAKDYATAKKKLADARRTAEAAGMVVPRLRHLTLSLHTYEGDLEAAAKVLVDHLKSVDADTSSTAAFEEHNWLSIVRQAQGDLMSALVEADARTRAGQTATWSLPNRAVNLDVKTITQLKETWHRAYLLRMHAEQVTGNRKEASLRYAEEARQAYGALAQRVGNHDDSVAVLEAFFAMHDGDPKRAAAAAKRVDPTKNDDVEDLYLVFSALDYAGEKDAATAVRKQIESVAYVSFVVPIMRRWIERDTASGPRSFSPRFPNGTPP